MPTLNWIGKEAVEKHHKEVPFRLLEPVEELSCGDADSGNLIVQGDNLDALKALLPRYAGKVKCIYIDPPYNTGNEGWVYNDNVNSPEIKKWLGEVVGKEGETLDRHDRWLCMMYPRLLLLKQFLTEDGVIFVSIDDNENHHLRSLMDEIFRSDCFVADIIWRSSDSSNNDAKQVSMDHNYTLIYSRNPNWISYLLPRTEKNNAHYSNPDNDPNGAWFAGNLSSPNPRENLRFNIQHPDGRTLESPPNGWRWSEEEVKKKVDSGEIIFTESLRGVLRKTYLKNQKGLAPSSLWTDIDDTGHNRNAKYELKNIFPEKDTSDLFSTPKPTKFIQKILKICTKDDDIILDSFSGSGTTGHAVLKQNDEDGGNRKFILVEMDKDIAENVTSERIKRVVEGYPTSKDKFVSGLGSSFQYFRLSEEPLFNANGPIRSDVTFDQLAEFVWFMETGTGLNASNLNLRKNHSTPYLGQYKDRAIFLLYNDILKDKSDAGGNVLNGRTLEILEEALPNFNGTKIVYGARTRFDKTKLARLNITFHQLPYELAVKTWF